MGTAYQFQIKRCSVCSPCLPATTRRCRRRSSATHPVRRMEKTYLLPKPTALELTDQGGDLRSRLDPVVARSVSAPPDQREMPASPVAARRRYFLIRVMQECPAGTCPPWGWSGST